MDDDFPDKYWYNAEFELDPTNTSEDLKFYRDEMKFVRELDIQIADNERKKKLAAAELAASNPSHVPAAAAAYRPPLGMIIPPTFNGNECLQKLYAYFQKKEGYKTGNDVHGGLYVTQTNQYEELGERHVHIYVDKGNIGLHFTNHSYSKKTKNLQYELVSNRIKLRNYQNLVVYPNDPRDSNVTHIAQAIELLLAQAEENKLGKRRRSRKRTNRKKRHSKRNSRR